MYSSLVKLIDIYHPLHINEAGTSAKNKIDHMIALCYFLLSENFFFYFGLIFVPTQMTDVNSILVRFQKSRKLASLSGLQGTPSSLSLIRRQFGQVVSAGSSRLSQEVVTAEEVQF